MFRMLSVGLIAGWIMHDIYNSDKEKIKDVIKKVVDYGKDKDRDTDKQTVRGD